MSLQECYLSTVIKIYYFFYFLSHIVINIFRLKFSVFRNFVICVIIATANCCFISDYFSLVFLAS